MPINWEEIHLVPVFGLTALTVGYLAYYYLSGSVKIQEWITKNCDHDSSEIVRVLFQKLAGFVLLGVIPAIAMFFIPLTFEQTGISIRNLPESMLWVAILGTVIIFINFFAARKPDNLSMYPQIRIRIWTPGRILLSSMGWVLYLLGYEFMFRGLLLFTCVMVMGVWPAIVLNTALYAFVHMPKGMKETLASIPMGILLCILTIKTGTIWVAFFAHVILAVSNEVLSIHFNPDMSFAKRITKAR